MNASINNVFQKTVYNNESNELGLKYHGGNEGRLFEEMVGCEKAAFYWLFYIALTH